MRRRPGVGADRAGRPSGLRPAGRGGRVDRALSRGSAASDSRTRARRLHRHSAQRRRPPEGRQLGRLDPDAARASGQAASVHVFTARSGEHPHQKGARSGHPADDRLRAVRHVRTGDAHDLARWTAASARARRAHVGRLLDGAMGRRPAHGVHHASQSRLAAAQRRRAQRPGHHDRAVHPSRQPSDGRLDRGRSHLSRGAVRSHHRTGCSTRARRSGARSSTSSTRSRAVSAATCLTICPDRRARCSS